MANHRGSITDHDPEPSPEPATCSLCPETEGLRWFSPDMDIKAVPFCPACLWGDLLANRPGRRKSTNPK